MRAIRVGNPCMPGSNHASTIFCRTEIMCCNAIRGRSSVLDVVAKEVGTSGICNRLEVRL